MRKHKKDPFAHREADKYQNPIYSREFILEHLKTLDRLVTHRELVEELELQSDDSIEALRRRLKAMERDGQIMQDRNGRYGLISEMELVCGRVLAHRDGYGFVKPDDGGTDLFLHAKYMRAVFHGDKVLVRAVSSSSNRREGMLVEVVERGVKFIPGRIAIESGVAFVTPSDKNITHDIMVPLDALNNAQQGQMVVAEITRYPTLTQRPIGRIVEVLGEHMAPGMETDLAIRTYDLPYIFPAEIEPELQKFTEEVPDAACAGRKDLRHLAFVTIDGEDAKDFDDAVFCQARNNGDWDLSVAIADVSHYVKPNMALDEEAKNRGNSVYFPTKVIPMLPEKLSTGLCSLKPYVNRLVLVCEMVISSKGKILMYRFVEGVIKSRERFTYTKVAAILEGDKNLRAQFSELIPMLTQLHVLYKVLLKKRATRGAMDFDSTETKIIFDEHDKIKEIKLAERNDAHRLIEECMLSANVCAADFLLQNKIPGIYRVHGGPKPDSISALRSTLQRLGFNLEGGEKPEPIHYAALLQKTKGSPYQHLISTILLRSLSQAVYSVDNEGGHFGLAYDAYTHFTSPIRRYPDLVVHRLIRQLLHRNTKTPYSTVQLTLISSHCSMTERRADDATRETVDWLKCEYMLDKVGNDYKGTIVGVTGFGFFVRLDEVYVEGLVHISTLANDYYHFDEEHFQLIGKRSGVAYRLMDKVDVRLANVDLSSRNIDFNLLSALQSKEVMPTKKGKSNKKSGYKTENTKRPSRRKPGKRK